MARRQNTKVQNQLPYKLYYFICEDEKSMQHYISGFKKRYNNQSIVIKSEKAKKGNDAKSIQKRALSIAEKFENETIYGGGFKIIPCFDKDDNSIQEISSIMSQNGKSDNIETLYNNPCYEYWLLLHTKSTAQEFINSEQCCKEAMKAINNTYGTKFKDLDKFKSAENIFDIVKNDLPKAIQNAKSLRLDDYNSTYTNAHIIFEEIIKNTQNNS